MKNIRFFFQFISFLNYFQSLAILKILMIVSKKSPQNLSDYMKILLKRKIEIDTKEIISIEKSKNSGNYNYDYTHSFFGEDF